MCVCGEGGEGGGSGRAVFFFLFCCCYFCLFVLNPSNYENRLINDFTNYQILVA